MGEKESGDMTDEEGRSISRMEGEEYEERVKEEAG